MVVRIYHSVQDRRLKSEDPTGVKRLSRPVAHSGYACKASGNSDAELAEFQAYSDDKEDWILEQPVGTPIGACSISVSG